MLAFNIKRVLWGCTTSYVRGLGNQQPPLSSTEQEPKQLVQLPSFTEDQQKQILNTINKISLQELIWLEI